MASNQLNAVSIEAREALCEGTCNVLVSLPSNQRGRPFQVVFIPTIECLRAMIRMADGCVQEKDHEQLSSALVRLADEIRILATMAKMCTQAESASSYTQIQQASDEPYLTVLRQAWPSISHAAEKFNKNEVRLYVCSFFFQIDSS